MKLVYPEIESVFHFKNDCVPSVIIENPGLFFRFTEDLYNQCCGNDGKAVMSINDTPVPISGNMDLITNFFPFEMNRKNLINKIITKLEKNASAPEFFERSQHLICQLEQLFHDLAFYNDLDLDFSRLSISALLKASGVCLKGDGLSLAEKISTYMDLMISNGLAKLFVFVNLRSLIDSNTMEVFTNNCCRHCYNILLIDNKEYPKLSRETRTVIDIDLCEF